MILDELKARKIAEHLNLRYSGTFGLLLAAKRKGVLKEVKPLLEKRATDFRFSEQLYQTVLSEAGE